MSLIDIRENILEVVVSHQHAVKPKHILLVFGTRPEGIKMAPVVHALLARDALRLTVCVTGQHREMLDQVLMAFVVKPDIDLNIMKVGQDLADVTCAVLNGVRDTLESIHPDALLVHGDTTTALATSLAAFYAGIPVGHVEAGLRTHDVLAPFPEEFNRQTISKVARWHFAPTELCRSNLLREQVSDEHIYVTGNTVIDALRWTLARSALDHTREREIYAFLDSELSFDWQHARFILMTGHRRENFGAGLQNICQAIRVLAMRYPDVHFVYPVHLNPQVHEPVHALLSDLANVHLLSPLEYDPFAVLMQHCYFVLTDSGGIQEEAPSLGKPVLVMRNTTERQEGVDAGTVELVGVEMPLIVAACARLIDDGARYSQMSLAINPYGDGLAAGRIADVLQAWSLA